MIKKFFTQEAFWVVSVLMATFAVAVTVAVLPPSTGGTPNEARAHEMTTTTKGVTTKISHCHPRGDQSNTSSIIDGTCTQAKRVSVRVFVGENITLANEDDWSSDTPGQYHVSVRDGSTRYDYTITVLRAFSAGAAGGASAPAPVDPPGEIPSILTDASGKAYSVFTPSAGGEFKGADFGIKVSPGAVPDGELIGMAMGSSGSVEGDIKLHHRLTLDGEKYAIDVIGSTGAAVSSYRLEEPAEVTLPLPASFSGDLNKVSIVVINSDGSLTQLQSRVRFTASGGQVVGMLSSFPAIVAVGLTGAPEASATPVPPPTPEPPDLPPTGGVAPMNQIVWLVLIVGMGIVTAGGTMIWRRRKDAPSSSRIS